MGESTPLWNIRAERSSARRLASGGAQSKRPVSKARFDFGKASLHSALPPLSEELRRMGRSYAGSLKKFIIFIASAKSPLSLILPSAKALIAFSLPAMICR